MDICVFWLPTIWHIPINEQLRNFEVKRVISDFGEQTTLWIGLEHGETSIEEARKDTNLIKRTITVRVSRDARLSFEFNLSYKNHSNNGMVVYEYTKPSDYPNETQSFESFLSGICYHHIKSLFHDHEVHGDRDSGLIAYIPTAPEHFDTDCIKKNDNEVLEHYIKQYEGNFSSYAQLISSKLQIYEGVLAKFNDQIGLEDKNGGMPGYDMLVKHGFLDFKRWFTDKSHFFDVEKCKKDILLFSLETHPHKICRNLNSYRKRLAFIQSIYKELLVVQPLPSTFNAPDKINELGDKIIKAKDSLEKYRKKLGRTDKHMWFYRYELESLDKTLSEIEIELGIYHKLPPLYYISQLFFFYRRLRDLEHSIPLLTARTRKEACKACEGASTEYVYCKTLLESRYNQAFHIDNYPSQTADSRRIALNIRNSIRYIESAKYRQVNAQTSSTHQTLGKAEWESKTAKRIAVLSIILTAFGLGMQLNDKPKKVDFSTSTQENYHDTQSSEDFNGQQHITVLSDPNTIRPPLWSRFWSE